MSEGRPLNTRQSRIRTIVEQRGIMELFHFTREENVTSIHRNGLLSRRQLDSRELRYSFSDDQRLDRHLDASSLSISFPNFKMFYRCRMKPDNVEARWAVIGFSASVMWERPCAFFPTNAAHHDVRAISLQRHRYSRCLTAMFAETVNGIDRGDTPWLRPCDPTDPQAEVLVIGRIAPRRITRIVVSSESTAARIMGCSNTWAVTVEPLNAQRQGRRFFASRDYYLSQMER